jgi:hypothetical protein
MREAAEVGTSRTRRLEREERQEKKDKKEKLLVRMDEGAGQYQIQPDVISGMDVQGYERHVGHF